MPCILGRYRSRTSLRERYPRQWSRLMYDAHLSDCASSFRTWNLRPPGPDPQAPDCNGCSSGSGRHPSFRHRDTGECDGPTTACPCPKYKESFGLFRYTHRNGLPCSYVPCLHPPCIGRSSDPRAGQMRSQRGPEQDPASGQQVSDAIPALRDILRRLDVSDR